MADYVHCKHHPNDQKLSALCMQLRAHDEADWLLDTNRHRMVEDLIRELREHPNVEGFELKLKF